MRDYATDDNILFLLLFIILRLSAVFLLPSPAEREPLYFFYCPALNDTQFYPLFSYGFCFYESMQIGGVKDIFGG